MNKSNTDNYAPPSLIITVHLQKKFISTGWEEEEEDREQSYWEEEEWRSQLNFEEQKSEGQKYTNIGVDESQRLLDSLTHFFGWVRVQRSPRLYVIHIVDQSDGAEKKSNDLILGLRRKPLLTRSENEAASREHIVHTSDVNAFCNTNLHALIDDIFSSDKICESDRKRIAVVGIHTESAIQFLMYELYSRFPFADLSICSALTATRYRSDNFNALEQIQKLFNVKLLSSLVDFKNFILPYDRVTPTLNEELMFDEERESRYLDQDIKSGLNWNIINEDKNKVSPVDKEIIYSLYRDSSEANLKKLTGGNTENWVFRVHSKDIFGNTQSTTVLKIGKRKKIVQERTNFERVEYILGNNAPRLIGVVEYEDRAGIKLSYASMLDEGINAKQNTFRSLYLEGLQIDKLMDILEKTFRNVLARFYAGATLERINLFKAYEFNGKGWNYKIGGTDNPQTIRRFVKEFFAPLQGAQAFNTDDDHSTPITGEKITGAERYLQFPGGLKLSNLLHFFEKNLPWIKTESYLSRTHHYVAYQHGDLHGGNIILDHAQNVWLIDFEYTERTHILKDIAKIENDILYEYTPINDVETLKQALIITKELLSVSDLGKPLPENLPGVTDAGLQKAWQLVVFLRNIVKGIVRDDRSSFQIEVALLRYSLFSVSLSTLSPLQKAWALASACGFAQLIEQRAIRNKDYYLDFISLSKDSRRIKGCGRLAISIVPGRKDRRNDMVDDIAVMKENNISKVLCLCTQFEFDRPSLDVLMKKMRESNIDFKLFPIPKGVIPSKSGTKQLCEWLYEAIDKKHENACIVSLSGLGRAGIVAACYLIYRDPSHTDARAAIELVKSGRGKRAIDSEIEKEFIQSFYQYLLNCNNNHKKQT
jgi:hypothetical protein